VSINDRYAEYDNLSVVDLVKRMYSIQRTKEDLEAALKLMNEDFDFLRYTKIPAAMEEAGFTNVAVAGVGKLTLTSDMHVSVRADKREVFHAWLRDNGREDLISESVHPSTLKATIKNMFKNGEEIPEDLLNINPFTRASITRHTNA
jgi:hypothetical protein